MPSQRQVVFENVYAFSVSPRITWSYGMPSGFANYPGAKKNRLGGRFLSISGDLHQGEEEGVVVRQVCYDLRVPLDRQ